MKEKKNITDEDLRRLVPIAWERIASEIPPKEDIDLKLSEGFKERMEKTLSQPRKKKFSIHKWIAAACIIIGIFVVANPFSSRANKVKVSIYDYGTVTEIIFAYSDSTGETRTEPLKEPDYIPEKFQKELHERETMTLRQTYRDDKGHLLYYETGYLPEHVDLETDGASIRWEILEGQEILTWEAYDRYYLFWYTEEEIFQLKADQQGLSREELVKIAESILNQPEEKAE